MLKPGGHILAFGGSRTFHRLAAPRGAKTGTQGRSGARTRSMVPYELGLEIRKKLVGE